MLVRVLEIPPSSPEFCFGPGVPHTFVQMDWFTTDGHPDGEDINPEDVAGEVRKKNYYSEDKPLLILTKKWAITLNYDGR